MPSLARHLVMFVKEPRMGRAKTRLAADIGTVAAWAFYRHMVDDLFHRLAPDRRWTTWIAATPDGSARRPRLWPAGARVIPQGRGDLGARMHRVMGDLPPGPVVIVGADAPDLGPGHVAQAFQALGTNDAVFGPAADGGYWLVGLRRRPRLVHIFGGVRWSTSHALSDTLANAPKFKVSLLEVLEDIDDGEALARWRAKSEARTPPRRRTCR